jgi:hypothetical protein
MKARSWRHDSLYHRLMSSYSVIIISLVLTIITIYISLLYHSIRQEEHKSSKNALAQLSQSMEDNVFSFTESFVTNYLLKDSNVHKYFTTPLLEQTNNQLYTAYNQVKQFLFTSNLYHSIYLYNVKAANIISTNGVYIIGSRQDRQDVNWLIHGDFPMQRRWMAMNDYLIHYSLPDTFRQDVVSLVMKYPVNARDDNYLGFVAVNLSVAEIYDSLNIQSTDNNYFLMFSPDGCLLASKDSYAFKDIDITQLSEHIEQGETEFFTQLDGENYDVLVTRGSHDFTYAYLCARSAALSKLTPVLNIAVIIALIAIIGPIVISMLLTRKIYLPIKLLTHRSIEVSKTFGQETESEKTEVAISSALDLLTQRVNILQNEIAAFEPERKNVLMRNIFGLNGPNSGRFGEHLKVLGLSFPYKTFLCIYVTFKNVQDIDRPCGRPRAPTSRVVAVP